MLGKTRVEGMSRLKQRAMERLPRVAKTEMLAANFASAREFDGLVRRVLKRGTPADGHLVDTLAINRGRQTETAVLVSIGDGEQTHVLHLEAGHRAADGTHVPARPFWYPSLRVLKKSQRRRAGIVLKKVVAYVSQGGT